MKTTLAQDKEHRSSHSTRKHRASFDEHNLRDYSKQGHVNPLKVKTSFLRNSMNLSSNENLLSLNFPNSTHNERKDSTGKQSFVFQSDRKQDFKNRKQQENLFEKQYNSIEFKDSIKQSSFNGHSRRFSDRLSDCNYSTDLNQRVVIDEKQNKFLLGLSSSVGNESVSSARNQIKSFAQKHEKSRFSPNLTTQQSVFYDSSLADYATRLGLTSSKEDSNVSIIKDQIQLILKKLAQNQCDIESLKRDKNIDSHMERVWKQISSHESKFQKMQRNISHINQKVGVWQKQVEKIRIQISKVNQQKFMMKNEVKELQNRIQVDIKQRLMRKEHQHFNVDSQGQNKVRREFQNLFKRLQTEISQKVESRLLEFKINSQGYQKIDQIIKTGKLTVSQRKASNWIGLVYKEILRVKRSRQLQQVSLQNESSDRSKLLSKAFTTNHHNRRQSTSWQQYQQPSQQNQQLIKQQSSYSTDIESNQVQYFIDENGYLLDENKFYILGDNDQMIRLDDRMLEKLMIQGVLKNIQLTI